MVLQFNLHATEGGLIVPRHSLGSFVIDRLSQGYMQVGIHGLVLAALLLPIVNLFFEYLSISDTRKPPPVVMISGGVNVGLLYALTNLAALIVDGRFRCLPQVISNVTDELIYVMRVQVVLVVALVLVIGIPFLGGFNRSP